MIRRVASALLAGGLLQAGAFGQTPPPVARPATPAAATPTATAPAATAPAATAPAARGYREPLPTDPAHPQYHAAAHRSIVRHNPLPRRTSYQSNYPYGGSSAGNSNSGAGARSGYSDGGVGRMAEYYDERTLDAPVDFHPVGAGRFDSGGGPNRSEQIAAQQAGTQRSQLTQDTINTYGRPYGAYGAGFGFGLGLSGGLLYNYPN